MIDNPINDDKMFAGGGEEMILARHYHILYVFVIPRIPNS